MGNAGFSRVWASVRTLIEGSPTPMNLHFSKHQKQLGEQQNSGTQAGGLTTAQCMLKNCTFRN